MGSSTPVTCTVITIFLIFMSLGLSRGSKYQGAYLKKISSNLLVGCALFSVSASNTIVATYFESISVIDPWSSLLALSLFLCLTMGPVVYLIEQTIPLVINLMQADTASQAAGDAYHTSTWGNVTGGLVSTLVFMYWLDLSWTIIINIIVLLFISIMTSSSKCVFALLSTVVVVMFFQFNMQEKTMKPASPAVFDILLHDNTKIHSKLGFSSPYIDKIYAEAKDGRTIAINSINDDRLISDGSFQLIHYKQSKDRAASIKISGLRKIKASLTPGGSAIFSIYTPGFAKDHTFHLTDSAFRQVFGQCLSQLTGHLNSPGVVHFICVNNGQKGRFAPYSDNDIRHEYDAYKAMMESF